MADMHFKNIEGIVSNHLCHSCGACSAVCQPLAISFAEQVSGLVVPNVDKSRCNNCGLCSKVCPGFSLGEKIQEKIPRDPFEGNIKSCYVGRVFNSEIYNNSQSGGIATALLVHLLNTKQIDGVLCVRMHSNTPPRAEAFFATSREELLSAQKSKYSPVPLLSLLRSLHKEKKKIAMVGLSCHVHGINKLYDVFPDFKKTVLFVVGLVCERVMSSKAIDFFIRQGGGDPEKAIGFDFKNKVKMFYPGNICFKTIDLEERTLPALLREKLKDFFTPPRCRICFDKMNVFADVVVSDPHGINIQHYENGASAVVVRTSRGEHLVSEVMKSEMVNLETISAQEYLSGQKIEKKKSEWSAFSSVWKSQFDMSPDYVDYINASIGIECNKKAVNKAKKNLDLSISLLRTQSITELFERASNYLDSKKSSGKPDTLMRRLKRFFS